MFLLLRVNDSFLWSVISEIAASDTADAVGPAVNAAVSTDDDVFDVCVCRDNGGGGRGGGG